MNRLRGHWEHAAQSLDATHLFTKRSTVLYLVSRCVLTQLEYGTGMDKACEDGGNDYDSTTMVQTWFGNNKSFFGGITESPNSWPRSPSFILHSQFPACVAILLKARLHPLGLKGCILEVRKGLRRSRDCKSMTFRPLFRVNPNDESSRQRHDWPNVQIVSRRMQMEWQHVAQTY